MTHASAEPPHVRLIRCHHGAYHLTVGAATLRLTEDEVAFVARAIRAMSQSHPTLRAKALEEDGEGPQPPAPSV